MSLYLPQHDPTITSYLIIGFFLISYKGDFSYGDCTKLDGRISTPAGLCSFRIELFLINGYTCGFDDEQARAFISNRQPCPAEYCDDTTFIDFSLVDFSGSMHSITTLGFFLSLAYFFICIFTKTCPEGEMSDLKKARNRIYTITGYVLIGVVVLMGVKRFFLAGTPYADYWSVYRVTFFLEAGGLFAFGFAWWVKGGGFDVVQD